MGRIFPVRKDLSGNRLYRQVNYFMVKTDFRGKASPRVFSLSRVFRAVY